MFQPLHFQPGSNIMAISEQTRQDVLNRDNCRCRACGFSDSLTLEVDHIKPRSLGGLDDLHNLQALCGFCNNTKKNVIIEGLAIQAPCVEFGGTLATITRKRLEFRQYVADSRARQVEELTNQARAWKQDGARNLTIRKRLNNKTTSGIVEDILKNILSASR